MSYIKFQNAILQNADANSVEISGNLVPSDSNSCFLGSLNKPWNHVVSDKLVLGPWTFSSINAGTINTSFGNNGTIIADFSSNSIGTSVVVDKKNNIIIGGFEYINNSKYAFAKYSDAGVLDTTFGQNGVVITDFSNDSNGNFGNIIYTSFKVVDVDSQNNILLAGYVGTEGNYSIFVAKYSPLGILDRSFGENGVVISNFSGNDSSIEFSVAIDQQDNIIVAGLDYNISDDINYYALAKYLPNGMLDETFGEEGKIISSYAVGQDSAALSVVIDLYNNIVIGGLVNDETAIARYTNEGILDTTFNVTGITISGLVNSFVSSLAIDQQNNIIVGGSFNDGNNEYYALAKILSSGIVDVSFGVGGIIISDFSSNDYYSQGNSVVVDKENNIILAGWNANDTTPSYFNYCLVKYSNLGVLDTTFGTNGSILSQFVSNLSNSYSFQIASAIALDQQNNIIVAGVDVQYNDANYALAKYFNTANVVVQKTAEPTTPFYSIIDNNESVDQTNHTTPVGSILSYAGVSAPGGWLLCDGSEVSKSAYPRLFSVIRTIYGTASNESNFVLPDLTDRIPVGKSNSSSLGDSSGNSSITLSVSQLPSHTHTGTSDVSGTHQHTGTTDSNGSHQHTGTTNSDGSHSHSISDPGHTHTQTTNQDDFDGNGGNPPGFASDGGGPYVLGNINASTTGISIQSAGNHAHTFTTGSEGSHAHTFTTGSEGSHAHTFTTDATGSGNSIDIRNKYVVINYIIKY